MKGQHAKRTFVRGVGALATCGAVAACVVEGLIGGDLSSTRPDASPDASTVTDATMGDTAAPVLDVAGEYVLDLRSGKNECALSPWDDASVSRVPVSLFQEGTNIRAALVDLVGLPTALLLGSTEYRGELRGDRLTLAIDGSVIGMSGPCSFAYVGVIDARYSDGGLSGTVRYIRVFRAGDCTGLSCESEQSFEGTRADGGPG